MIDEEIHDFGVTCFKLGLSGEPMKCTFDTTKIKKAIEKDKMEAVEYAYTKGWINGAISNPKATANKAWKRYKQDNKI